jgi:biotin synthase
VQIARYLINEGITDAEAMKFSSSGEITDYGLDIAPYIQNGQAFMTSGCPGQDGQVACNRPFGNERASAPMRNYPYLPEAGDIAVIKTQIWNEV